MLRKTLTVCYTTEVARFGANRSRGVRAFRRCLPPDGHICGGCFMNLPVENVPLFMPCRRVLWCTRPPTSQFFFISLSLCLTSGPSGGRQLGRARAVRGVFRAIPGRGSSLSRVLGFFVGKQALRICLRATEETGNWRSYDRSVVARSSTPSPALLLAFRSLTCATSVAERQMNR